MDPFDPDDMFDPEDEFEFPEGPQNREASEAQRILQEVLSKLPDQAQAVVAKVDQEFEKIDEIVGQKSAMIREEAERKISDIEAKAENRRRALLQHAIEQLEPLQTELVRSGDVEKGLATLMQIRMLEARLRNVLPDPGSLLGYEQVGKSFKFCVTGASGGPVWGTDVYTSDSHLATAAVHAGAVELGEVGEVRVIMVDMSGINVTGSFRNGVMSHDWGPYMVGYRVERAETT